MRLPVTGEGEPAKCLFPNGLSLEGCGCWGVCGEGPDGEGEVRALRGSLGS